MTLSKMKCFSVLRALLLCGLFVLVSGCSQAIPSPTQPVFTPVISIPTITAPAPVASSTPTDPPPSIFDPQKSGELLALGQTNPEFGALSTTMALDPLTGQFKALGEGWPVAWSPSGRFMLARHEDFIVYDRRGGQPLEGMLLVDQSEFPLNQNTFFWLPPGVLPGPDDWLVIQNSADKGLEALAVPSGERRALLPVKSLGDGIPSFTMKATTTGWLAWVPVRANLAEIGRSRQTLSAIRVVDPSKAHTWTISENIRKEYYTLLDAVPGASLVLLGAAPASTAGMDGVALYTFDLESGALKDLRVKMLPNPDAYAWSPTRPGEMALAVGEGHFTGHNKRLALLDVQTAELKYLTGPEMAAFEPDWSQDGKQLVYAALPDQGSTPGLPAIALKSRAIYLYNLDTGQSEIVTHPIAFIDGWPRWLKDQKKILFTRYDGQKQTTLYLKDLAGDAETSLITLPNAAFLFEGGRCQSDQCSWDMILLYTR